MPRIARRKKHSSKKHRGGQNFLNNLESNVKSDVSSATSAVSSAVAPVTSAVSSAVAPIAKVSIASKIKQRFSDLANKDFVKSAVQRTKDKAKQLYSSAKDLGNKNVAFTKTGAEAGDLVLFGGKRHQKRKTMKKLARKHHSKKTRK